MVELTKAEINDIVNKVRSGAELDAEAREKVAQVADAYFGMWCALEESIRFQSHYADLLTAYDGGERMTFGGVQEWLARLRTLEEARSAELRKLAEKH